MLVGHVSLTDGDIMLGRRKEKKSKRKRKKRKEKRRRRKKEKKEKKIGLLGLRQVESGFGLGWRGPILLLV